MRLRACCALLFSAGAVLACTAGALDGFSGGADPDAGGSGDAGPEASSGNDAEAGGGNTDAGVDASTCPSTALLCESFDTADPLATWAAFLSVNASQSLVSNPALSPPKSLHASLDGPATGSVRNAYISRSLGSSVVSHAKYSYSLYIESRPSAGAVEICSVRLTSTAGAFNDFYISYDATGASLHEQHHEPGGSYVAGASLLLGTALATGKWLRVGIELMLTDPRSMAVSLDGVEIARTGFSLNGPGTVSASVGFTFGNETTSAAAASFDDVAFEVLP